MSEIVINGLFAGDTADRLWLTLMTAGTFTTEPYPVTSKSISLWITQAQLGRVLVAGRDITTAAKAGMDTDNGNVGIPFWTGRSLPSAVSADVVVTDYTTDGKATVTTTAGPTGTVKQRVYKNILATPTVFALVAEVDNGGLAGGVAIGGPTYPATEASLIELAPSADESITDGHASLTPAAAPTAVLASGAGTLANGTHKFKVVNVGNGDTESGDIRMYLKCFDPSTGKPRTFGPMLIPFEVM